MREKIINLIEQGISLKEISENLGVNYNTVRQISVSNKLLKNFSEYLTNEQIEKMKSLGNNIRALAPIKNDKDLIITLADYIYDGITRKEIEEIVSSIDEIRERKSNLIENYDFELSIINEKIEYLNEQIKLINSKDLIDLLTNQFRFIKDIEDKEIRKGYLNLIAIKVHYNRVFYALGRRVNLNLWNKLRRAEAIIPGANEIVDMEKFKELTINTIKRNNYYKDFEKERNIVEIKHLTVENQLKPLIEENNNKIIEYKNKIENVRKDIGKSTKKAINNYFEEREIRNKYITKYDSITHPKIQQGAAKWLYNSGYISTIELSKDKYKFDVIGYDDNTIIIMEAKASLADLKNDKKIIDYMNYCDKLYIVSNNYSVCDEAKNIDSRVGVIKLNDGFGFQEVIKEAENLNNGDRSLVPYINKKNSRKFIFGY
ncbi:MmcB family DNA repair protein [Clostridium sp. Sa3CUN1]|uniref:MmcB family DNA repair protein n=1 Tax=Clostridium gallinarum TaxID=2762246 RepID=A0ABR8Q7M1_9CLOT|nr:MmcB family DNA repair protein [Clostridium gallinarum]